MSGIDPHQSVLIWQVAGTGAFPEPWYDTAPVPTGGGPRTATGTGGYGSSPGDDVEVWIEAAKAIRVGGDGLLNTTPRADYDVGVGDVGGTAGGEQPPDVGGIDMI